MAYRILHTADWHLGKTLNDQERHEEHRRFLDWLLGVVEREQVDAVIVAGDIFDSANPSTAAEGLYYDFVARLYAGSDASLVVIAGNHDSASHLEAPKSPLQVLRAHVAGALAEDPAQRILLLPKDNPKVAVAMVPFLRERDLRLAFDGETEKAIRDQLKGGIEACYKATAAAARKAAKDLPVVAMGHLTVAGAASSDSERDIHIGGIGSVSHGIFPADFAYVALGHLHRPQAPDKQGRVRYAGSPFPLSFSEVTDRKEVRILDIEGGAIAQRAIEIPVFRRLTRLACSLDNVASRLRALAAEPAAELETWVEVQLEGFVGDNDPFRRVQSLAEGMPLQIIKVVLANEPDLQGRGLDMVVTGAAEELLEKPKEVFERLLDQQETLTDADKKALRLAFAQLLEKDEAAA